jgi:CheY-like chemotaxis protein
MHRLLIVDDEFKLRETVATILSRDDYVVDTAADGAEALRLLELHPYDLVLSDLRMPELAGPQLYDAIQQRGRAAMPAVVFMTGHVGDSIDGALPPGALILEKPFSLNTLCETVDRLLATRGSESGGGAHAIPR